MLRPGVVNGKAVVPPDLRITPAMVSAGVYRLVMSQLCVSSEVLVAEIYRAMDAVKEER